MRQLAIALAGVLLLVAIGCGHSGPTPIRGVVTLDGKPLPRGRIEFEPAEGKGPLAAAEIVDGRYDAAVMPGARIVRITGGRVVGQHRFSEDPQSPLVEDIQPLVGPAYNTESTLRCDVSRGQADYDFELKTTP